jgi:hypothetical protein
MDFPPFPRKIAGPSLSPTGKEWQALTSIRAVLKENCTAETKDAEDRLWILPQIRTKRFDLVYGRTIENKSLKKEHDYEQGGGNSDPCCDDSWLCRSRGSQPNRP